MKHVFVATPMYGGMCSGAYTGALMNLGSTLYNNGIMMSYSYMMNESLITRARNKLAFDFLNSDATHLMFIDADIGFNPVDIPIMVEADKDIICGLYPRKEINWFAVEKAVHNGVPPQELNNHTAAFVLNTITNESKEYISLYEPIEIKNGATGFMLIKRQVFEKLSEMVPKYKNVAHRVMETVDESKTISEFFATSIDEDTNVLLSEDYHFCTIARKAGFKVYGALWPQLSHIGAYTFEGRLHQE